MDRFFKLFGAALFSFVFAVVMSAIFAIPTKLLINHLFTLQVLSVAFGGYLSFFGAWGLNLLCALLLSKWTLTVKS